VSPLLQAGFILSVKSARKRRESAAVNTDLIRKKGVQPGSFFYFFLFWLLDITRPNTIPIPIPIPMLSRARPIATPIAMPIANPLLEKLKVFFFKSASFC
jgi:hypothetical protein